MQMMRSGTLEFNVKTQDAFANIGLTYVDTTDVKRLVSIDEKTVFISTQGEMSFFLADSDEDNSGKVLLNIKRVNID
ncbi:hypothetical protein KDD30_07180 [Photobacterium sp. GJ3]|uniref:hypothetical protein n=1 Tax=Photobacterium sp. GJ3 TaxID=2829502 RepID=UPI001B8D72C3|nr:hypothetical protein [Photobacterium sp. GJ3]QUJ68858.1 hypothetical protein KDD30_07180 [Photobacterium sp. GJ3]